MRRTTILLTACLLAGLTACGGSGDDKPAAKPSPSKTVSKEDQYLKAAHAITFNGTPSDGALLIFPKEWCRALDSGRSDLFRRHVDSGVTAASVDAYPVVAWAVEGQDGEFFVQVVHHGADHELAPSRVRGDLDDLLPVLVAEDGLCLVKGDRDVDVAATDAGKHRDFTVGDLEEAVVDSGQVRSSRSVLVTDEELVVSGRHETAAVRDLTAHLLASFPLHSWAPT
ncbi:hypothetical protein [Streptomyces sp. WAC04114]|uniref:hypothetical protein n=1 Tax=Streptomyces sp. WAC04114 TaxID=2867961 RepID=UPI001C8CC416|nr:hypothetical protein [Streptomyces sp. WAC04114]MBX9366819.1 hypothetical protein [Streptomyces sp. WAC04114]